MIRRILVNVMETTVQQQPESIYHQNPFTKPDTCRFGWLTNVAPCFPVKSSSIKILTDPEQFYDILLRSCSSANERITLASLYFGNGKLEKNLVENIRKNPNFKRKKLKVNVLLDYTRGSRSSDNSRTTLIPLLQHGENCRISLYHTPELRGIYKKIMPDRWNELFGLQHMKLYIFDDTLVISGANLSKDYFTNRQDRYVVVNDRKLCDFYCGLVDKVQTFSFSIDQNNRETLESFSPYKGNREKFVENAGYSIEKYLIQIRDKQNNYKTEGNDTWIFPMIQMAQLGIQHDAHITEKILRDSPKNSRLNIATGYFNLTKNYMKTLIHQSKTECNILMAHPKANGFLGAKGLAGKIPHAYCLLAQKFRRKYRRYGQENRIKLFEYFREGWTYHGKGLWYYPPNYELPVLTFVGSPNFGERSVKKDLETQLAIITENRELQEKLHEECENLYKFSLPMEENRQFPKWVHGFMFLFKSYF